MTLTRIAVTGGPCAGKTTVMEAVRNQYGSRVLVMPEVASILLGNGFPRAGTEIKMCERYADSLQASILPVQINMEKEYLEMGHASIANLVLFDRGVMDGASYLGKTVPYFLERFGLTQDEVFGRYDAIIHMESSPLRISRRGDCSRCFD
jgi:predicted ATPase